MDADVVAARFASATDHDRKGKGAAELAPVQAALRSALAVQSHIWEDPWSGCENRVERLVIAKVGTMRSSLIERASRTGGPGEGPRASALSAGQRCPLPPGASQGNMLPHVPTLGAQQASRGRWAKRRPNEALAQRPPAPGRKALKTLACSEYEGGGDGSGRVTASRCASGRYRGRVCSEDDQCHKHAGYFCVGDAGWAGGLAGGGGERRCNSLGRSAAPGTSSVGRSHTSSCLTPQESRAFTLSPSARPPSAPTHTRFWFARPPSPRRSLPLDSATTPATLPPCIDNDLIPPCRAFISVQPAAPCTATDRPILEAFCHPRRHLFPRDCAPALCTAEPPSVPARRPSAPAPHRRSLAVSRRADDGPPRPQHAAPLHCERQ